MSNPDWPGPYWHDQDAAGNGSGQRGGPDRSPREKSPWDTDGSHFWRDDRGNGRAAGGRERGDSRRGRTDGRGTGQYQDQGGARPVRGSHRGAGQPRQQPASGQQQAAGRSGRFSQTADDLRNKLGLRNSTASRGRADARYGQNGRNGNGQNGRNGDGQNGNSANGNGRNGQNGSGQNGQNGSGQNGYGRAGEDFWGEPDRRRGARAGGRTAALRARFGQNASQDRTEYPGWRRPDRTGDGYPDDYGARTGSRTALRERPGDFWTERDYPRRDSRSRVAERPGTRRGPGGGGGQGGGGWDGGGRMPPSRGERFKQWLLYGSWWRHWTWKKLLGLLGVGFAACCLLGIAGFFIIYELTPIPTDVSEVARWESSSVYFSNGKLLGTFTNNQGINRDILTTSQIPQVMDNAIIAAEDRNFYHEGGISLTGIVRAGFEDVFGGGGLQGGSTITEQYAKNYYANIGASRTASTKIKEIFIAIKLAHERSKPWILTNYLNTVPFGDSAYGVGAAAQAYFDVNLTKPGSTLTLAQAAMLAAMPNQPGYFSPDPSAGSGYSALVMRWQYVLDNMVKDNAITQQQANALCASCALPAAEKAFNASVQLNQSSSSNGWSGYDGYLMAMVQTELTSPPYNYSLAKLDTDGLRITTTFNQSLMQALATGVNEEKQQLAEAGTPLPEYDHFGISLENPKTGAIVAIYGGPGYGVKHCAELFCDYNMAEAPHPVGSSMKPYVLATAIAEGMDVQNSVLNGYQPLWIPPDWTTADRMELSKRKNPFPTTTDATSNGWWLSDSDTDLGPISVVTAAAQSSDPAFTDLAHRVGVQNIINMAKAFGVGQNPFNAAGENDLNELNSLFGNNGSAPGSVQIALGEGSLTPIEQASTFATLADDGIYHEPHVISKLYVGQTPVNVQAKIATHVVLSAAAAADEDYALSFDNVNGTAFPNAAWDRPVIGKTGTLGNGATAEEAWFIGAIPQYAMAVGLWTNDQAEVLDNLATLNTIGGSFGGAWPAATWLRIMNNEFNNLPAASLPLTSYAGFTKWVQVQPATKPVCKLGQFHGAAKNCTCPPIFGQHCGGNPNPTPGCQFGQPCTTPTPAPSCTPSFGQPCTSPTPTASPSPSPTCTPSFGQPCTGGQGDQSDQSKNATSAAAAQPAEEAVPATADELRLVAAARGG